MSYRYAIFGAGRQGLSAAYDLGRFGDAREVVLFDHRPEALDRGVPKLNTLLQTQIFSGSVLDVQDKDQLRKALHDIDAAVSAVPYSFNPLITEAALECRSSLCDLGGHTEIVRQQLQRDSEARQAGITLTPDCGFGPGLNISQGIYALSLVEEPEELFIWDGGLPQHPVPPWNYQLTFHINGLTNEYYGNAYFLRDGQVTPVPCLGEREVLDFPPPLGRLEAAVTSGGLSTAPWTLQGKLKTLENKSLRYPGHWQQFQAYQWLGLFEEDSIQVDGRPVVPREVFHTLLEPKITAETIKDICVLRARCNGKSNGKKAFAVVDLVETYDETTGFTAMEKFTGWHAAIVAMLSARGEIPRGAVPVEVALTPEALVREGKKRGWEFKIRTETAA